MKKYRVSVCKGPDCRRNGADRVYAAVTAAVAQAPANLASRCEVFRGGCYGLCHLGPNLIVREQTGRPRDPLSRDDFQLIHRDGECHYDAMTPEKVPAIVEQHLTHDQPVEALRSTGEERPAQPRKEEP